MMRMNGSGVFILGNICKLTRDSTKKYYYIDELIKDSIGFGLGVLFGFLVLGPVFVSLLKVTLIAWTYDFHQIFFLSYLTLESWVGLILLVFIVGALLMKLIQVDKYIGKMGN